MTKTQVGGGKSLFGSNFSIAVQHRRKSGQELTQERIPEPGADAEVMEGQSYLACSLWFAQPTLLKNPGPPAQGWYHAQWAGPSLIDC